ncbi:GAF and ANTAR domain-containing protein [Lentzea aerocolonigenes]|uniref:GAF and ANTAR domain-containing protein n=1 Tax=Lentzea aerocolonigenes TaxID=68170 RepID=UPI0004C42222|nr:GAF and ANTAR domain-containing protein [Lentzea aerocolonigenes]MCP2241747.1 GAF domain-containing protein [Lentzea aerocolonigenes]
MTATDDGGFRQLAETLSHVARTLQAEPDVDTTLGAIVKAAVEYVPEAEHAGISLVERGKIRTVAPTSGIVDIIDQLQYDFHEGPCVDAIAEHQTYRVGDVGTEARWPSFGPAAADHGIHSLLSYRLFVTDRTLGALNLYSSRVDAFDERTEEDGLLFATHAAIALVGAQREAQLGIAIENRDIISTAKGIRMERHDLDAASAFRMLVEASQSTNVKLHDAAAWLVENRT